MSLDYFADSDEFMAQQLLRMRGLDEDWAELLCDGLAHGLDLDEALDELEYLEDYGLGPEDADAIWTLELESDLSIDEAIAVYVDYLEWAEQS